MAVRFSAVKLTANEQECKLLVSAVPTSLNDLEGWRMFENFVGELDKDTKINVQVDTYLYGEGEIFDATPEEVAYMMMRQADDSDFLNSRCSNLGVLEYDADWSPKELFGMEMN